MGIFSIFKKKTNVDENNKTFIADSDVKVDGGNVINHDVETNNQHVVSDLSNNDNKHINASENLNANDVLFTNDDYLNELNIDTSYYEALLKEETPVIEDVVETQQEENDEVDYNTFDVEKRSEELEKDKDYVDYDFAKKSDNDDSQSDIETNNSSTANNNSTKSQTPKKNDDLFSYLDDPFLVDNFLNRDSFSFQKFLEDKKKENPDKDVVVDLEDEDQRLQFIKEIESNIVDNNFQNANLIDSGSNLDIQNEENDVGEDIYEFDDEVPNLEGDELYKEKIPSLKDIELEEKEIILDDIIIPESKPVIPKAPTNNFRDFFANDQPAIEQPEENIETSANYFNIANNDDPLFLKDSIKHNLSLNKMTNYTAQEKPETNKVIKRETDIIEDFYDFPYPENTKKNVDLQIDDETINSNENQVLNSIREKKLIDDIKQRYENEIVMNAKKKIDEDNANKRPNFNDELLDLIRKGYPN